MALGPLLALPLAALPDDGGPLLAGLPLTPVTALGLTMGAAWAAFLLAALLWFRDPPERWVGRERRSAHKCRVVVGKRWMNCLTHQGSGRYLEAA